jgi:hypothetical protein
MADLMPLVHQARRTIRNRQEGNFLATDDVIADLIEVLSTAYLAASNERASRDQGRAGPPRNADLSQALPDSPRAAPAAGALGRRRAIVLPRTEMIHDEAQR